MKQIENIPYVTRKSETLCLDLYLPDAVTFPLFVFMHGGGLEAGNKTIAKERIVPYLTQNGIAVASLAYRMYPNAKYPDFIEDAAEGVSWLSHHINDYGHCEKMFVGGSSAGGYLSMMLCFDDRWLKAKEPFPIPISGYFHNAGQPTAHFNVLRERGIDSKRVIVDESAPLFHVGKAESYPPMHFTVSTNDMPGRLEQTMLMLATLRDFGYDQTKIALTVIEGKHCEQDKRRDADGVTELARLVCDFIQKWQHAEA